MMKFKTLVCVGVFCAGSLLAACGNEERRKEIQPFKKMTNDATAVANEAWVLINQLDQVLYAGVTNDLDQIVRKPLRELSNRWRIEVKMTDAVTEGKYALCRKSLNSLDVWARAIQDGKVELSKNKQADYERDKALCEHAINHPELGNTPPR